MHDIGFSYSRWTYSVIIVSTWVTAWMFVYIKTVMLWQMKHLRTTIWSCESWMSRNLAPGLCLCKRSYMHNTMKSMYEGIHWHHIGIHFPGNGLKHKLDEWTNLLSLFIYSGTPLMRTPLGPSQSALIRGVSLFQGLFCMHKIHSKPHTVFALQWMSAFQGCSQGGVPL